MLKINNIHRNHTNFQSIRYRYTEYTDCNGVRRATQNSTSVRDDLDCHKLAKIIKNSFSKQEKINLMPMNASDLTETYAITTALIDELGFEKVQQKFAPILATDVDSYIVEKFGRKGLVALTEFDKTKIGENNIRAFFKKLAKNLFPNRNGVMYNSDVTFYKTTQKFSSLFKVETMDLQERLSNLDDDGNSVVIIRNCLAQSFGVWDSKLICINLGKKIKTGSLLVIGDYDRIKLKDLTDDLKSEGFHEIEWNIFKKGPLSAKEYFQFNLQSLKNIFYSVAKYKI